MPAYVRLDVFPASVVVGDTTYAPSRAIVTDDTLYVFMDASSGPEEVYSVRMDDFSGRRTTGYKVTTDDGDEVYVNRASGCGCGSRLRGFRPFAGVPEVPTQ